MSKETEIWKSDVNSEIYSEYTNLKESTILKNPGWEFKLSSSCEECVKSPNEFKTFPVIEWAIFLPIFQN